MPIPEIHIERRARWVSEIARVSVAFGEDTDRIAERLNSELQDEGIDSLLSHLEFCGAIPESFDHDSSAEKLYSKYTDILLSLAFQQLGFTSMVFTERSDTADVECVSADYSFVADAKAFRLSRTAKNQKDFKIAAMHAWKRGKPFAVVVCPLYQLPTSRSQIYEQASTHSVCILSYSHLIVLIKYAMSSGLDRSRALLCEILESVAILQPSKEAYNYWATVNSIISDFDVESRDIWTSEKYIAGESLAILKEEGLIFLAQQRERIMLMSREDAIVELLSKHNIESRVSVINRVASNNLLELVKE
jgi:HindIII restriction endonuclease